MVKILKRYPLPAHLILNCQSNAHHTLYHRKFTLVIIRLMSELQSKSFHNQKAWIISTIHDVFNTLSSLETWQQLQSTYHSTPTYLTWTRKGAM